MFKIGIAKDAHREVLYSNYGWSEDSESCLEHIKYQCKYGYLECFYFNTFRVLLPIYTSNHFMAVDHAYILSEHEEPDFESILRTLLGGTKAENITKEYLERTAE